jgi:hypothetical protein
MGHHPYRIAESDRQNTFFLQRGANLTRSFSRSRNVENNDICDYFFEVNLDALNFGKPFGK